MKSLPRTESANNLHAHIAEKVSHYVARLRKRRVPEAVIRDAAQEAWRVALEEAANYRPQRPGSAGFFYKIIRRQVGQQMGRWMTTLSISRDLARAGVKERRAAGVTLALAIVPRDGWEFRSPEPMTIFDDEIGAVTDSPEDWVSAHQRAAIAVRLQRRYREAVRRAEMRMAPGVRAAGRLAKLGRTAADDAQALGFRPPTVECYRVKYRRALQGSAAVRQSLHDMEALFT